MSSPAEGRRAACASRWSCWPCSSSAPPRPRWLLSDDDPGLTGPDAADALIEAYTRNLDATFVVEGELTRTLDDGRTLSSAYLSVQRPPDHLQRSLGGTSGDLDGRTVNCSTPPGGEYTCAAVGRGRAVGRAAGHDPRRPRQLRPGRRPRLRRERRRRRLLRAGAPPHRARRHLRPRRPAVLRPDLRGPAPARGRSATAGPPTSCSPPGSPTRSPTPTSISRGTPPTIPRFRTTPGRSLPPAPRSEL